MKKIYNNVLKFIKYNYKELIILAVFCFLMLYHYPYYVYRPGGSINLSDRIKINNEYKNEGSYSMNYVTVTKGNLPSILLSFFIKDWDIVKEDSLVYEGSDYDTTLALERIAMENSKIVAIYNAYTKAGKNTKISIKNSYISYIDKGANTNLKILDQIIKVNNKEFSNFEELRKYTSKLNVGDKISILVKENGKEVEKFAYIYELEGTKIVGISVYNELTCETDPKIEITSKNSEAGSSGGLMLTLAIYDDLLEEDLTHGKNIMGTGTIDEKGNIGEIGGIKYKLLGASKDKADIFFVPSKNYDEAFSVYKEHKLNLDLVKVDTLDDAINYLKNIK